MIWCVDARLGYVCVLTLQVKNPMIHGRNVSYQVPTYHAASQPPQRIPDVYSHTTPSMSAHTCPSNWQTVALPPGPTTHMVGVCGLFENVTLTFFVIHSRIVKFLPALQPFRHNHPFRHSGTHRPPLLLSQRSKKRSRGNDCSRRRFVRFLVAQGSSEDPKNSKGTFLGTYPTGFAARS